MTLQSGLSYISFVNGHDKTHHSHEILNSNVRYGANGRSLKSGCNGFSLTILKSKLWREALHCIFQSHPHPLILQTH